MKLVRNIALTLSVSVALSVPLLGAAAYAVGCGGSVEQAPPASAASGAATKAPVAAQTHGMVKLFGDALGDVALRADQRTQIDTLASDAEARHAPLLEHRRDLAMAFADQIERGAVDRATLQPKIDALTADVEKVASDDRAALLKLHDILDKDQRNAFVDALEKRFDGKGRDFHAEGRPGMAKLKQLAEDLKLTDDQRSQIRDIIRDAVRDGMRQHDRDGQGGGLEGHGRKGHGAGKSAMEAFRDDKLDVAKLGPFGAEGAGSHVKGMADMRAAHIAGVVEKILPLLTPEQRKLAAEKLREAATRGDAVIFVH